MPKDMTPTGEETERNRRKVAVLLGLWSGPPLLGMVLAVVGGIAHIEWMKILGIVLLVTVLIRKPLLKAWLRRQKARQRSA